MTKLVTSWCAIKNTYLSFVPPCCCSRRPLPLLPPFLYAARLFVHFKALMNNKKFDKKIFDNLAGIGVKLWQE
jgi:hypothetical protein